MQERTEEEPGQPDLALPEKMSLVAKALAAIERLAGIRRERAEKMRKEHSPRFLRLATAEEREKGGADRWVPGEPVPASGRAKKQQERRLLETTGVSMTLRDRLVDARLRREAKAEEPREPGGERRSIKAARKRRRALARG